MQQITSLLQNSYQRNLKIPYSKMKSYDLPLNSGNKKNKRLILQVIFLEWSSEQNYKIAKKYGFKKFKKK